MPPASSDGSSIEQQASNDPASQGGDSDLDFKSLFEQTNAQLEETKGQSSRLAQELESVKGSSAKSSAELERIKKAISGEEEETGDPVQSQVEALEAQMDQYLQAAIDHERAGKPIPLTINTAVNGLKHQIAQIRENAFLKAEIAKLQAATARQADPRTTIDQTAFSNMDSHIEQAIQAIYGVDDEYADVRNAQFDSISKQVIAEIKDVKAKDPALWGRIARDRKAQVNLVNHFVKKTIPPKARQIMEQDEIRRTPLTNDEVMNAWREAKALSLKDPKAVQHANALRTELITRLAEKNMAGGSHKQRMGELFTE